jgi:outer membrane protein
MPFHRHDERGRRRKRAGAALVLSLFFVAGPAARAQEPAPPAAPQTSPTPTLTLTEALRRAVAANPATETARSRVSVAEAQIRQLRSAVLPQVSIDGGATRNTEEVAFETEDGFRSTILPENDWNYRLILRQPVYAGGRELKALRQSRLNRESATQGVTQSEDVVLLNTAANYLAVAEGDALIEVERRNLELAGRRRKQSQAFYEAGEVTRVDVLRADTDMKEVERALALAQQDRDTAASRLRLNLALDGAAAGAPPPPLTLEPPRLDLPPRPQIEELIRLAQDTRPEVQQAALALQIAELEVAKQRAARLPVVRAEAVYTSQKSTFPSDQYGSFSLNLNLPIWDSGEISSRVAQAREQLRQAEIALAERKRLVREDVIQALVAFETAERSLALAQEQLTAAQAEYDQSFELYRAQEATSLDLATSETSLAEARRAVVTSTLDRYTAELIIWAAVGNLKDVVLKEEVNP